MQAVRLSLQDSVHQLVHARAKPKHEILRAVEPVRIQCGAEHERIVRRVEEFRVQVGELQHGAIGRWSAGTVIDTVLDAFNARLVAILPSAQSRIFRAGNSSAGRSVLHREQYEASYDGEHGAI